jgi:hypothetical protein
MAPPALSDAALRVPVNFLFVAISITAVQMRSPLAPTARCARGSAVATDAPRAPAQRRQYHRGAIHPLYGSLSANRI